MEERKKKPHIPSNYVSLLQRREWWLQQQQQQQQNEGVERETQNKEVKIDGENESQSQNHQQRQELQQQDELVKEHTEEESVSVSVSDVVGGSNNNNKKKRGKRKKQIKIRANGEKNEGGKEIEERVERKNMTRVYVGKGKREGLGGEVKVGRESVNVVGGTSREGDFEKVEDRHVWTAKVAWGEREREVSRCNVKKRDSRPAFRPKVRDSTESENAIEVDGWKMKVERNIEVEKIGVKCEEDGMVEGSGLLEEVDRKFSSAPMDEQSVVSWRNRRKSDTQVEFRPKVRDSVEGSNCGVFVEWKSGNVAGGEVVERNIKAEKIGVEGEEDGMVKGSGLMNAVDRKFKSVSLDEESKRHVRLSNVVERKKEESAGSLRNGRKLKSIPKIRDLVEASNAAMVIEQKSDCLTAESCLTGEVERNVEDGKVGERHVTHAYVIKGHKDNVVPRRGQRKRDRQLKFRSKGRKLDEGYNSHEPFEKVLENIVAESTQKAENDRNVEDQKIEIEHEEDVVVEETNLIEAEQKLSGCSVDEERVRSWRSNGVERNSRPFFKGYGGYNNVFKGRQRSFGRGNEEYYDYNGYDSKKNMHNSGGNGRKRWGGDAQGDNCGRVWVKKVEAAILDDVAEGQSPSVLMNGREDEY